MEPRLLRSLCDLAKGGCTHPMSAVSSRALVLAQVDHDDYVQLKTKARNWGFTNGVDITELDGSTH